MKVAVLDDYQDVARRLGPWSDLGEDVELTVFHDHVADDDALVERLRPFDVVVAMRERTPFPAARLERLPSLRLLVTTAMPNAAIDVEAARRLGVVVCGTRFLARPAVELTWGLIQAITRRICDEDRHMREGGWQRTVGVELEGRTLGVVGLGRIGSRIAEIGRLFEMRVVAWSQNLSPEAARAAGAEPVTKDELFAAADVVTLHVKLSERTRGLVGARELALMKPTAVLVNTARGPIVDEPALLAALHDGTIGGAALDVYDVEPLPVDHPLRTAPNTVLTPHLGYVTLGGFELFYADIVEDIAAFRRGEPVRVLT